MNVLMPRKNTINQLGAHPNPTVGQLGAHPSLMRPSPLGEAHWSGWRMRYLIQLFLLVSAMLLTAPPAQATGRYRKAQDELTELRHQLELENVKHKAELDALKDKNQRLQDALLKASTDAASMSAQIEALTQENNKLQANLSAESNRANKAETEAESAKDAERAAEERAKSTDDAIAMLDQLGYVVVPKPRPAKKNPNMKTDIKESYSYSKTSETIHKETPPSPQPSKTTPTNTTAQPIN